MSPATATKRKRGKTKGGVRLFACSKCASAVNQQAASCWHCHATFIARDGAQRKDHETDLAYARRTLARHLANATRTDNAIRRWTLRVRALEAAERRQRHGHDVRQRGIALKP